MKDELRSQEELSVAAVAYITPMWLAFLVFKRWRSNSFTRYHLAHACLVFCALILFLLAITGLAYVSNLVMTYHLLFVLLIGGLMGFALLFSAALTLYCGINAYRGRYTVLPVLTRIYYLLFSQRQVQRHDPYDSRNVTQQRKVKKP
jgi:uncharacterized membrane protein